MRLEERRRDRPDPLAQRPRREQGGAAADGHPAARPRAAAVRHHAGVARAHGDAIERHVELGRDDLRQRRVRALPLLGDADQRGDGAAGLQAHRRALLAGDRRAADAVELRARARQFHEAREPDPDVPSLAAGRRLLTPEAVVLRDLQEPRERGVIAAAVENVAGRGRVREVIGAHEIAAAQLRRIDPEVAGDELDHALGDRGGDRMPHGAVLRGDDLVLRDHTQGGVVVPHAVRAGQETEHLAAFHHARARIGRVGADRRLDRGAHRRQDAVAVRRHLDADGLLAGVDVGQEGLAPARDELHGTAQRQRHRAGGHVVLVDVDLDPEAAADVGRHDAQAVLRKAEELGEHRLHHVRHLGGDPHGERARRRLVVGDEAARLERHPGVPSGRERARPDAMGGGEARRRDRPR